MADVAGPGRVDAARGVRARGASRRRGDDDPGSVPVASRRSDLPAVTFYTARGCHLCDRARAIVAAVREDVAFDLREVDITGVPELEDRYRELLPVLEIDGRRAFAYHVPAEALRGALLDAQTSR